MHCFRSNLINDVQETETNPKAPFRHLQKANWISKVTNQQTQKRSNQYEKNDRIDEAKNYGSRKRNLKASLEWAEQRGIAKILWVKVSEQKVNEFKWLLRFEGMENKL